MWFTMSNDIGVNRINFYYDWSWLNIDILKEWNSILEKVNSSISDYKSMLENNEITYDMKVFCYEKIEKKVKYKELIEETLKRLNSI